MRLKIKRHISGVLKHLYINPLEKCNLRCKICYTRKTAPILSEKEILGFVGRYRKFHSLETITFCGGEVFTLKYFPGLVNKLTEQVGDEVHLRGSNKTFFGDVRQPFPRFPSLFSSSLSESLSPKQNKQSKNNIRQTFNAPQKAYSSSVNIIPRMSYPVFIQIITNGTIDRLDEFENPNMVNLIVSLDGLEKYHDDNRGKGSFTKSIGFIKKALKMGFHVEIFSIVTRQNFYQIPKFEQYLSSIASIPLQVTYHPRKPVAYLMHHPKDNISGKIDNFDFLEDKEMVKLMKEHLTFPPKKLGCYQISLMSDGIVYGCCEGIRPIGKINDDIHTLITNLRDRLEIWQKNNKIRDCLGCSQPDFVCGIKKYLEVIK